MTTAAETRATTSQVLSKLPRGSAPRPAAAAAPPTDLVLLGAVLALTGLGVVIVYSSGAVFAERTFGDGTWLLKRHIAYAAVGLLGLFAAARLDYRVLERLAFPLSVAAICLLIATMIPGVGVKAGGAVRWLRLGPVTFQPAEVCKLVLIILAARAMAARARGTARSLRDLIPYAIPAALMFCLTIIQPDFGSTVIYGLILLSILFVSGFRLGYLFLGMLGAVPVVYYLVMTSPYRLRRVLAFLNPWEYRQDIGYQLTESLLSLGSGGIAGLGLGGGKQKLLFLPSAHNDFVMAAVGEELGFIGVASVIALFLVLGARGLRAALRSKDPFGLYLAFGITFLLSLQAALNAGVAMGVLPAKGLTLPFISYGGSSLIICLVAAGLLLSVDARNRDAPAGGPA
jgi:cell division protein FtsW